MTNNTFHMGSACLICVKRTAPRGHTSEGTSQRQLQNSETRSSLKGISAKTSPNSWRSRFVPTAVTRLRPAEAEALRPAASHVGRLWRRGLRAPRRRRSWRGGRHRGCRRERGGLKPVSAVPEGGPKQTGPGAEPDPVRRKELRGRPDHMRLSARARLISRVILRCSLAERPVVRRA